MTEGLRTSRQRMLAVDLGAESGRVVVGGFDGNRLTVDEIHRFRNRPVTLEGRLVWDIPRLYTDMLTGIRRATADGPLSSIGIDGWGLDFGLLDGQDRLLSMPVHYRDPRTDGVGELLRARVTPAEVHQSTGTHLTPINTLHQLLAMVRDDDPLLDVARTMLLIPDLMLHLLTGSVVTEATNATTSGCYDIRSGSWARSLLARIGVPDRLLAPVIGPGTLLGPLLPQVADDLWRVGRPRIVAPATHDTASAVAAIPFAQDAVTAFVSCGTWSLIGVETDAPVIGPETLAAGLTNELGLGGRILLRRSLTGLWLLQACRASLARAGIELDHEDLVRLAEASRPGTAFVDPDDPRFFRSPGLPDAVRGACIETGQAPPPDVGTLARVLLESLALAHASTIRALEHVTQRRVSRIHIVGGGSRIDILCQATADASGLPVDSGPAEASAIGNLLSQAMAAGSILDLEQGRELVRRSFRIRTFEPTRDWSEARERFAAIAPGPG